MRSLAVDPVFGVDDFMQAKYRNESETVANNFLFLLFGKPGFFPSIPSLGVNIPELLYQPFDDIDIPTLKNQITTQCSELLEYVIDESFDIQKTFYQDQPMLIFILPVQERTRSRHFAVGITTGENGEISYNFTWVDE